MRIKSWRLLFGLIVGSWLLWLFLTTDLPVQLPQLIHTAELWIFISGWFLLPLALGLLWRRQIHLVLRVQIDFPSTLRIQALAWAGRYLPGKAGLWIAKIGVARQHGIAVPELLSTVLVEQILFLFAGAAIGVLMLAPTAAIWIESLRGGLAGLSGNRLAWVLSFIFVLLLAASTPLFLTRIRHGVRTFLKKAATMLPGTARLMELGAWHAVLHVGLGLSLYPLFQTLLPDSASILGISGTIGALAVANVAGIAIFFAPAGLGARDLTLALFFSVGAGFEEAVAVAALIRFLTMFADVAFSAAAGLLGILLQSRPDHHAK